MIIEFYTLFGRIPLYRDQCGHYATYPRWKKDIVLHLRYIADFRICCPVKQVNEHDAALSPVSGLSDRNVVALRPDGGWGSVVRNLVPNAFRVRRALSDTQIAHSDGAGWAFPVSYYILIMRLFLKFQWIIVVESSFFRKPAHGSVKLRRHISHYVHTFLLRQCVQAADARIFTNRAYQELFLGHDKASLIAPAVWIDQDNIVSDPVHEARKPDGRHRARFLFPSRLIPDKGVQTVLDAIHLLEKRHTEDGTPVPQVDIIGEGPLAGHCRQFAANHSSELVRFHEPVSYGAPFFAFLQDYDAIIVANLQDEQPRIIYDAFSQGLPCLSSETGGTHDLITSGETGFFFKAGDATSLADRLSELADAAERLHQMGHTALSQIGTSTHENMHREREVFLKEVMSLASQTPGRQDDDVRAQVEVLL